MLKRPLQGVRLSGSALSTSAVSTNSGTSAAGSHVPFRAPAMGKPLTSSTSEGEHLGPSILPKSLDSADSLPTGETAGTGGGGQYFAVLWTADKKKHKTYDDGVLSLDGRLAQLFNTEGRLVAKEFSRMTGETLSVGGTLTVGRNELEVVNRISREHYESGRIFSSAAAPPAPTVSAQSAVPGPAASRGLVRPTLTAGTGSASGGAGTAATGHRLGGGLTPRIGMGLQPRLKAEEVSSAAATPAGDGNGESSGDSRHTAGGGLVVLPQAKCTTGGSAALLRRPTAGSSFASGRGGARPRHDPLAPNALVLFSPPQSTTSAATTPGGGAGAGAGSADAQVAVVVDPLLTRFLRPHQREGVSFMYNCVALAEHGCILADDMGLGKTLQSITLLWTLLKQSPRAGVPHAHKAIVVCPSSLVLNWRNEFKRWLGDERCRPNAVRAQGAEAASLVNDFMTSAASVSPVLIISYEMLRKHVDAVSRRTPIHHAALPTDRLTCILLAVVQFLPCLSFTLARPPSLPSRVPAAADRQQP